MIIVLEFHDAKVKGISVEVYKEVDKKNHIFGGLGQNATFP